MAWAATVPHLPAIAAIVPEGRLHLTHPGSHCFPRRFGSRLASLYKCTWKFIKQAGSFSGVSRRWAKKGGVSSNPGFGVLTASCLLFKKLQEARSMDSCQSNRIHLQLNKKHQEYTNILIKLNFGMFIFQCGITTWGRWFLTFIYLFNPRTFWELKDSTPEKRTC